MAGKKISEMAEKLAPSAFTWIEILDLEESDPALQNKKMKQENANANDHVQNTDQYLDFGGPDQISAGEAVASFQQAHDQNTDQYLDEGGAWETAASSAFLGFISSTPLFWIQNETGATATGYARIGANVAGSRTIDVNSNTFANLDMSAMLTDLPIGTYLWLRGKQDGSLVKMTTVFAITGSWYSCSADVIDEFSPDVFTDGDVVAINIQN